MTSLPLCRLALCLLFVFTSIIYTDAACSFRDVERRQPATEGNPAQFSTLADCKQACVDDVSCAGLYFQVVHDDYGDPDVILCWLYTSSVPELDQGDFPEAFTSYKTCVPDPPTLTVTPDPAVDGGTVNLTCTTTERLSSPQYRLTTGTTPGSPQPGNVFYVTANLARVVSYQCQVSDRGDYSNPSAPVTPRVVPATPSVVSSEEGTVINGTCLTLTCTTTSALPSSATYTWTVGGLARSASSTIRVTADACNVVSYTCQVSNDGVVFSSPSAPYSPKVIFRKCHTCLTNIKYCGCRES